MSSAPSYSDIGKDASDLFNKGFDFDTVKIDFKPKVAGTTDFKCSLTSKVLGNVLSPSVSPPHSFGFMEVKNKLPYGVNSTCTIRHNSQIQTELAKEFLANKAKLVAEGKFSPVNSTLFLKSKASYKNEMVNGSLQLEKEHQKPPSILGNLVLSYRGFLLGSQLCYTASAQQVPYPDINGGYQTKEYSLTAAWNNNNKCMVVSTHQRIDKHLELAFQGIWERNSALHPRFNVAAKYTNSNAKYKVKVNSQKLVGFSYSRLLQPGFKLTLSSLFDLGNFAAGHHRLGVAFDFE